MCNQCVHYETCRSAVHTSLDMFTCSEYESIIKPLTTNRLYGVNTLCTIVDEIHKYDDALKEVGRMYTDGNNRFKTEYDKLAKRYAGSKAIIIGKDFIKDVIFNPPATIVFWSDDTKTVVKCCANETFDPEKGIAMAFFKKMFGNTGSFNKIIHKWVEEKYVEEGVGDNYKLVKEFLNKKLILTPNGDGLNIRFTEASLSPNEGHDD